MSPSQGAGTNLLEKHPGGQQDNWGDLLGAQIVPGEARGYPDIEVTFQMKQWFVQ